VLTALASHPFARKKAKGWGTGRLVGRTRKATAGPSTLLRCAQDDSLILDDGMVFDGMIFDNGIYLDDSRFFYDGVIFADEMVITGNDQA
jgi:hypothetical protein